MQQNIEDIDVLLSEVAPRDGTYVAAAGVTQGFVPATPARSAA